MIPFNLDLDTLRTLVIANDLNGYGQAAARLGRTPAAVSQQMRRLQEQVGATLFRKAGRTVALTETGEMVLRYARRMLVLNDELLDTVRGAALRGSVRLGCSQDFAESILPGVLSRFSARYPLVMVELHIEGNAALADAVDQDRLDLALVIGHAERPLAQHLGELPLVWIAGGDFHDHGDRPIPLVLLGPQCAFRKAAARALDLVGRKWRVAALSPSLAGLWASARGGLGITVRTPLGIPSGLLWGESLFDLPVLQPFAVTLHARSGGSACITPLRTILAEAVAQLLSGRFADESAPPTPLAEAAGPASGSSRRARG